MIHRNATAAAAAGPLNPVAIPASTAEANALVDTVNRGFNELRDRVAARENDGQAIDSIRGEMAQMTRDLANVQDALTRFARPSQPGDQAQHEERLAAFGHWLRTGDHARLEALNARAGAGAVQMSAWQPQLAQRAAQGLTSNGPYGGYIVLDNVSREIDRIRAVFSNLRQYARVVNISQGDRWSERTRIAGASAQRTTEQGARAATDALKWAINEITVTEAYAEPTYSRQALADPFFNLESEVFAQLGEAYGTLNSIEHVNGTGVGEPEGFMATAKALQVGTTEPSYGTLGYVVSGHASNWSATAGDEFDVFTNVRTALKPEYLANARYFMNRVSLGEIMLFKDANDLPIWQPSMQAGVPSSLRGYPVALIEHMDARAANAFPVTFGDMRQHYTIVDRQGMDVLTNPYKVSGFVTFETWMRDGAKVTKSEAMKAIKIATS